MDEEYCKQMVDKKKEKIESDYICKKSSAEVDLIKDVIGKYVEDDTLRIAAILKVEDLFGQIRSDQLTILSLKSRLNDKKN